MNTKPFSRDFRLMILGQIISLFGNGILRFALSLYVLELTGSAAVFGGILALSMVPTVLCAPVGGVLADRLPRQNIMAGLDFLTAALTAGYGLFAGVGRVGAVGALMVLLSLIQALYQPSVQAAMPALVEPEGRMAANGIAAQVQSLAALLGPVLGGALYGWAGLGIILWTSAGCFALSAVMELFLRIPFQPQPGGKSPLAAAAGDLKEALEFLVRERPRLVRMLLLLAGLNLFLSSLLVVGLPYLIKIHLGLGAQFNGAAEGAMGLGAVLGGTLSGVLAQRVEFRRSYLFLTGAAAALLPLALVLGLDVPPLAAYGTIVLCVLLGMACATLFNVFAQTFFQQETPPHLMGKTAAFISAICMGAYPLGQALYGVLFDQLREWVWLPVAFGSAVSLGLSLLAGRTMRGLGRTSTAG